MTRRMIALLAFLSMTACASTATLGDKGRNFSDIIKLSGSFTDGSGKRVASKLDKAGPSKGDVLVIIDSPGGRVLEGDKIYAAIRKFSGKHKLVCIGKNYVASMAFNILSQCDERWAYPETTFLMHDPYRIYNEDLKPVQITITLNEAKQIVSSLQTIADEYRAMNAIALGLDEELVAKMCDEGDVTFDVDELLRMGYLKGTGKLNR